MPGVMCAKAEQRIAIMKPLEGPLILLPLFSPLQPIWVDGIRRIFKGKWN